MKYVSLFAGIGGFDLALNRLGHECVYANEWDKYSAQTYEKNFNTEKTEKRIGKEDSQRLRIGKNEGNNERNQGLGSGGTVIKQHTDGSPVRQFIDTRDITTVPTSDIPDCDLLVGGFPCQSFSIAGKRKGFNDTRGTLFFEIARILKDKRPRYFILENVKGLLSHDTGKTFQTILGVLTDLGYEYQWQVLNSKNFGVPQNRERVFIVGHIRGESRPKVFPIGGSDQEDTRRTGQEVAYAIDANYHKGTNTTQKSRRQLVMRTPLKFLQRNQKNIEGDYSFTVDGANTGGVMIKEATKKGYTVAKEGDSINFSVPNSRTRRGRVGKRVAQTLDTASNQATIQDMRIRRLTPLECERLQGFPDNWTEGVSDTQRYKQLGNAVTVNVVQAVAERLI